MFPFKHNILDHVKDGFDRNKKRIARTTGAAFVTVAVLAGGVFAYIKVYDGKIYPNVYAAGHNLGGLTTREAADVLLASHESMLNRGLPVKLEGEEAVVDLRASGSTDPDLVYNLIDFDVDGTVEKAYATGRSKNNVPAALLQTVKRSDVEANITLIEERISESIKHAFEGREQPSVPTRFIIALSGDDIDIDVKAGEAGRQINTNRALQALSKDVRDLSLSGLTLVFDERNDLVTNKEALALGDDVREALEDAPYTLTHTSDAKREFSWTVTNSELADWLLPVRTDSGTVRLGLDKEAMAKFIEDLRKDIDVEPQNARFVIEDGKVVEFAGSLDGETLNEKDTLAVLTGAFGGDEPIKIAVDTTKPDITTGSVNDLGITEVVGVGVSNFSGSPRNRISNIQHGANKLNGLLIAPDEEFSLVEALKPFTIADGWLPELVIKGDEIKPEVGGGACQFGTTLFRAAMNTGLDITQRRNHSLVVSYYNDPSNGSPGTDATIYDPAPDFRFRNDTGNYLLLTTEVDLNTSDMIFTFWGTDDGREGYYTPPQVLSWSGYGETVYKETPDLAPGETRCQAPHSGATASFDYIVEYNDGTKHEKTYTSKYRSLPRVCLVGIDPDAPEEGEETSDDSTEPASDEEAPDASTEETAPELGVEDVDSE